MLEKHRQDYDGEHILIKTTFQNGKKVEQREWMENPITNQHISGRAAVISGDTDLPMPGTMQQTTLFIRRHQCV